MYCLELYCYWFILLVVKHKFCLDNLTCLHDSSRTQPTCTVVDEIASFVIIAKEGDSCEYYLSVYILCLAVTVLQHGTETQHAGQENADNTIDDN